MSKQTTTTETGITEIRYDNYLFKINVLSEKEIGLEIIDTKAFQIFILETYTFQQSLNASTLIAALNKKDESYINLIISQEQNSEKDILLKVILKVSYDFLPSFEEIITLPIKQGDNIEKDLISAQMMAINEEIKTLHNAMYENIHKTGTKYVIKVVNGDYFNDDSNNTQICQLKLPKGKYEINLSLYAKYKSENMDQFIYFYLQKEITSTYILNPDGQFYKQSNYEKFIPHFQRSIIDISEEGQRLTLFTFYTATFPWLLQNLILSATSI